MGNRNYMHKGKITRNDVLAEVFTVEQSHGYPNDGWRHDGYEITLIGLAEIWAEQENENQPEDRGTFPFWLHTHIDDNTVEEPENRVYGLSLLVTTSQSVRFEAPAGMNPSGAKSWYLEHCDDDDFYVSHGSEDVVDEQFYADGE